MMIFAVAKRSSQLINVPVPFRLSRPLSPFPSTVCSFVLTTSLIAVYFLAATRSAHAPDT